MVSDIIPHRARGPAKKICEVLSGPVTFAPAVADVEPAVGQRLAPPEAALAAQMAQIANDRGGLVLDGTAKLLAHTDQRLT